jgi:hypothetical protein
MGRVKRVSTASTVRRITVLSGILVRILLGSKYLKEQSDVEQSQT